MRLTCATAYVRTRVGRKAARALLLLVVALGVLPAGDARGADDVVAVPEGLQAELLAKVAGYDRSFAGRAGDRAHVIIVAKPGDDNSSRAAARLETALRALPNIGGLPHDEVVVSYAGAAALAPLVRARHAAIVYFTPGFGADLDPIRASLDGVDVLSVSAVADYVPRGIVLGFDLVSGKPKLLVHLGQARRQNVAFKAEVLKMMRVFE